MTHAFVFPGQGSQSVGMLAELACVYPLVKQTFEEASDTLGYDLWKLSQDGPEDDLNQTDKTQPAMLAGGIAAARVWQTQGGTQAGICAGHSLGEYTALVYAGSLDFKDALKLVEARGRYMQEAVPAGEGAMAAVLGLDDEQVIAICDSVAQGEVLSAANFNSPGQVVIAGQSAAVARAVEASKQAGAKRALLLAVSVPSHCELMRPAEQRLREDLAALLLEIPEIPVIHNVDAAARDSAEAIGEALCEQLYRPVRWVDCVSHIAQTAETLVECGPGKVLSGLNKRINKQLQTLNILDPKSLDKALEVLG